MSSERAANGHIALRLMPVASTTSPQASTPAQLKATLDGTALFKKETDALIAAIKKATFDRRGNIVTGEAKILAAATAARKAAPDYVLTLYIKSPVHVSDASRQALSSKVSSLNGVLDRSTSASNPKPRS